MLKITNKTLRQNTLYELTTLQNEVNTATNFAKKVEKAQKLWKEKNGKKSRKKAFQEVEANLKSMCVGTLCCNYCEGNEAADIEHIYPKSFFPERCFVWENYLLACKQCNTGYKLDKCFVLDDFGNLHDTQRDEQPKYATLAFINPREDDPTQFIWLNTQTWEFEIQDNLSDKDKNKAAKTLDILQLNKRDYLKEGRKKQYGEYYNMMNILVQIVQATDKRTIDDLLEPYIQIDMQKSIEHIKKELQNNVQNYITKKTLYPSVWWAIKHIESKTNAKWKKIFSIVPNALNW